MGGEQRYVVSSHSSFRRQYLTVSGLTRDVREAALYGLDEARRLADLHDLQVLSAEEALEHVFHQKQRARRRKRDAA